MAVHEPILSRSSSTDLLGNVTFDGQQAKYQAPIRPDSILTEFIWFHTVVCLFVLLAEKTGLAPEIRFAAVIPYLFLIFIIYNIDRIQIRKYRYPPFMLFAHCLIPYSFAIIISREAYAIIALLYVSGVFLFYSQSGDPQLRKYINYATLVFFITFWLSILFMRFFYTDSSDHYSHPFKGAALHTPITFSQAMPCALGIIVLGFLFQRLGGFVEYVSTITERRTRRIVQLSTKANQLLERVKTLEEQVQGKSSVPEINTPLELLLDDINKLKKDSSLSSKQKEVADHMLDCLSEVAKGTLFRPLLTDSTRSTMSPETTAWISSTLHRSASSETRHQSSTTSTRRKSVLSHPPSFTQDSESDVDEAQSPLPVVTSKLGKVVYELLEQSKLHPRPSSRRSSTPEDVVLHGSVAIGHRALNYLHNVNSITRPSSADLSTFNSSLHLRRSMTLPPLTPNRTSAIPKTVKECLEVYRIEQLSKMIHHWDFDVFSVVDFTKGCPLTATTMAAMYSSDLLKVFNLEISQLAMFLLEVEKGYLPNPYHNSLHAADVVQAVFYLLEVEGLGDVFDDVERLALIIAAAVHDFKHPGQSNNFLRQTMHPLTLTYNDSSPLENHHVASMFRLMSKKPELNFLEQLDISDQQRFRNFVIELVLATDLQKHMEIISSFKLAMADPNQKFSDVAQRKLLGKILIKAADVCNPIRPQKISYSWSLRCMEEFYRQGDQEKLMGMKISPFYDRYSPQESRCQVSFIDFLVRPMYEQFFKVLKPKTIILFKSLLTINRQFWVTCSDEVFLPNEDKDEKKGVKRVGQKEVQSPKAIGSETPQKIFKIKR
ncbi:hypothetical protein P9112_013075 [Eukaryota sp. TZLM1-RC]